MGLQIKRVESVTSFVLYNDVTDIFVPRRRVRLYGTGSGYAYGTISAASFDGTAGETTVTLYESVVQSDAATVDVGIVSPASDGSLPRRLGTDHVDDSVFVTHAQHDKAMHDALGIDAATLSGTALADFVLESEHTKAAHDALGIDADTVDGLHASAFAAASHTHTLADLTDHNKAAHDALAIDADTVDGQHASAFAAATHTHALADLTDHDKAAHDALGIDAATLGGYAESAFLHLTGGTVSGDTIFASKVRVGSTDAPTYPLSVTGTIRVSGGNVAVGGYESGSLVYANKEVTDPTSYQTSVRARIIPTFTTTPASSFDIKALYGNVAVYPASGVTISGAIYGLHTSAFNRDAGTLNALYGALIQFGGYTGGTGTIEATQGIRVEPWNSGGGTINYLYAINVASPNNTGTINTCYGLYIASLAGNTTYGIYQAGTGDQNILAGNTRIGSTSAPTCALDVSGNALVSGTLGIVETSPGSTLGLAGNVAIGSSYASQAAPTNGAIIEGNVGIKTSNPSSALHVFGSAKFENADGNIVDIVLRNQTTSNANVAWYLSKRSDGTTFSIIRYDGSTFSSRFKINESSVYTAILSNNLGFKTETEFGGGTGVIGIADASAAPSSAPTNASILYSSSGSLHEMRSDGTSGEIMLRNDTNVSGNLGLGGSTQFGGGAGGVLAIPTASTTPASNPTGAIVLYFDGTNLKARKPDGTVVTIA